MNSAADDIRTILDADSSLGLTFAVDLFINREPAKPNDCVTIFDTGGYPPYLGLTSKGYEYPSIQVRIRNADESIGYQLIQNIMVALHGLAQQTVNGTLYTVVYCSSGPALLDWDEGGRCRWVANFNLQRREQ